VPDRIVRSRDQILGNLEALYRGAFERTQSRLNGTAEERPALEALDFAFQQEQLRLEVLLDVRDLLARLDRPATPSPAPSEPPAPSSAASLLEKAEVIRRLTRLR
jgi:hypothetical protein